LTRASISDLFGYDEHGNYHAPRRKPRKSAPSLKRLAAALCAEGLRPVSDPVLDLVRADCPQCRMGERDPLGLYRPLAVMAHGGAVLVRCDFCGGSDV
jgi:hypothetical protein